MISDVKIENILKIYETQIAKNAKNRRQLYFFESSKMENIIDIYHILKECSSNYSCKYNIFLIREPKYRIVMSLSLKDKIINYFVTKYCLEPYLSHLLDFRNVATRKGYGTSYARKLVRKYLELHKKYENFYILKLDISKYFYSIDHDILIKMIEPYIPINELGFVKSILNSTNEYYVNEKILKIKDSYEKYSSDLKDIPLYEKNKGLPIGNMTSQFFSIFYLFQLDHYIVHKYHFPYYVRYMDDFLIISHDKKGLQRLLKYMENELFEKYHLTLNKKKTHIVNAKEGFLFLGHHYSIVSKKTIIKLSQDRKKRLKNKVKKTSYLYKNHMISCSQALSSIQTLLKSDCLGSSRYIKRVVNREWFSCGFKN